MARPYLPSFFGRGDDPFGSLFREVQKTFEDFSQRTPKRDEQDKDKNWHVVERSYGSFSRTIPLPFDPDPAKVEAKFDKGVLRIHLPKPAEVAKKQQKIEIKKA